MKPAEWRLCFSALFALSFPAARGDLPIHATVKDIVGSWELRLGKPSDAPTTCGSDQPNRNRHNLQITDADAWLEKHGGGLYKQRKVALSDERHALEDLKSEHRAAWLRLVALDEAEGSSGSWTPIYDQGVEVRLDAGRLILTGIFDYKWSDDPQCFRKHPTNSDQENESGETVCYETNSGRIKLGWYTLDGPVEVSSEGGQSRRRYGCWTAVKKNGGGRSFVNVPKNARLHNFDRQMAHGVDLAFDLMDGEGVIKQSFVEDGVGGGSEAAGGDYLGKGDVFDDVLGDRLTRRKGWTVHRPAFPNEHFPTEHDDVSFLQVGTSLTSRYACGDEPASRLQLSEMGFVEPVLPRSFSAVPEPFNRPGNDFTPVLDQGSCGACFAIAAEYVLRSRAAIGLQRLVAGKSAGNSPAREPAMLMDRPNLSETDVPRMSFQSVLDCSFLSQGCSGGYPFLVGRWANMFGLPDERCMPYTRRDDKGCPLDLNVFASSAAADDAKSPLECSPAHALYASDWGYVGGCYECCSERAMMEEIYFGGPIVVALDVPRHLLKYHDGVFNEIEAKHARYCDDPHSTLNGWEFTNHAVVIVGWGEEAASGDDKSAQPYWIVRNSWGPQFGRRGYMKIARGKNLGGVEAQAVYLDPDFNRGLLLKISSAKSVRKHDAGLA